MPPWELVVDLLLQLVLPAAVASCIVLVLVARFCSPRWWDLGVAAAAFAGLTAGNWQTVPLPYLPLWNDTGWPWLLPLAIALLASSGLTSALAWPRPASIGICTLAGAAVSACFLVPGELRAVPWWMLGFGSLAFVNVAMLERMAQRFPGPLTPLVWAVTLFGGAAGVLLYSHSARLSNGATLFASALLGMAAVTYFKPLPLRAVGLAVGAFLPGLMISGYSDTFSEVPWQSFALAAAAPLSLGLLLLPAVHRLANWQQVAAAFLLPLIPNAIAVALAIAAEGWELGY